MAALAVLTAPDGSYTWHLPPGEYELIAADAKAKVSVTAGAAAVANFKTAG